jgi:hypothetical protein
MFAAAGFCAVMAWRCGPAAGADDGYRPTPRFVLWDETRDRPWTTSRGNAPTPTNATACLLAMQDAVQEAPAGTRFSCRKHVK